MRFRGGNANIAIAEQKEYTCSVTHGKCQSYLMTICRRGRTKLLFDRGNVTSSCLRLCRIRFRKSRIEKITDCFDSMSIFYTEPYFANVL